MNASRVSINLSATSFAPGSSMLDVKAAMRSCTHRKKAWVVCKQIKQPTGHYTSIRVGFPCNQEPCCTVLLVDTTAGRTKLVSAQARSHTIIMGAIATDAIAQRIALTKTHLIALTLYCVANLSTLHAGWLVVAASVISVGTYERIDMLRYGPKS